MPIALVHTTDAVQKPAADAHHRWEMNSRALGCRQRAFLIHDACSRPGQPASPSRHLTYKPVQPQCPNQTCSVGVTGSKPVSSTRLVTHDVTIDLRKSGR